MGIAGSSSTSGGSFVDTCSSCTNVCYGDERQISQNTSNGGGSPHHHSKKHTKGGSSKNRYIRHGQFDSILDGLDEDEGDYSETSTGSYDHSSRSSSGRNSDDESRSYTHSLSDGASQSNGEEEDDEDTHTQTYSQTFIRKGSVSSKKKKNSESHDRSLKRRPYSKRKKGMGGGTGRGSQDTPRSGRNKKKKKRGVRFSEDAKRNAKRGAKKKSKRHPINDENDSKSDELRGYTTDGDGFYSDDSSEASQTEYKEFMRTDISNVSLLLVAQYSSKKGGGNSTDEIVSTPPPSSSSSSKSKTGKKGGIKKILGMKMVKSATLSNLKTVSEETVSEPITSAAIDDWEKEMDNAEAMAAKTSKDVQSNKSGVIHPRRDTPLIGNSKTPKSIPSIPALRMAASTGDILGKPKGSSSSSPHGRTLSVALQMKAYTRTGWVHKQSNSRRSKWRKRYLCLHQGHVLWGKNKLNLKKIDVTSPDIEKKVLDRLTLLQISSVTLNPNLTCIDQQNPKKKAARHFYLTTTQGTLHIFRSKSLEETGKWIEAFSAHLRLRDHTLKKLGGASADEIARKERKKQFKKQRSIVGRFHIEDRFQN